MPMVPLVTKPLCRACAVVLAAAASALAHGQELSLPAIDESPTAQLLIDQATDQARANPREAVRLLVQVLDDGPGLLVRSSGDQDLFTTVGRRVRALLAGDPSLRAAFRREVGPDADARLASGELEWLVRHRLDTQAGLEASLRLAESEVARGRFASAAALLERTAGHDLLAAGPAARHAALLAEARSRLGGGPVGPFGGRTFVRSSSSSPWGQIWSRPASGDIAAGPLAIPSPVGDDVVFDTGGSVVCADLVSGSLRWESARPRDQAASVLRAVAVDRERAVVLEAGSPGNTRQPGGGVTCLDARDGRVRWTGRLDRLVDDRAFEGAVPEGAPVIVDGRAIVVASRWPQRSESVTLLAAIDLDDPQRDGWSRIVATGASIRAQGMRAPDSPVVVGGVIYLSTGTGAVAAIDSRDGDVRWLRRFRVPVRDLSGLTQPPAESSTPAVVRGRVFAATPDRSRIVALDAADGSVLAEIPSGTDLGVGSPAYLLGDEESGLVFAVGDGVAALPAERPGKADWTFGWDTVLQPPGRVTLAREAGRDAPLVFVPGRESTAVLDGVTGAEVMRIDGLGPANPVPAGGQIAVSTPGWVACWMPVDEAERIVRQRMARSGELEDARAAIAVARRARSAALLVDAAREAAGRSAAIPRDDPRLPALIDLLVEADADAIVEGEAAAEFARTIDRVAALAGVPERAGFAAAERLLRQGDAAAAARTAVTAAFAAASGTQVPRESGGASAEAEAVRLVAQARAVDPSAVSGAEEAIAVSLRGASGPGRAAALRAAARLGAGTGAGDRALDELVSGVPAPAPGGLRRLLEECVARGATPSAAVVAALGGRLPPPTVPEPPAAGGQLARVVSFRGSLVAHDPSALPLPGGVLCALDGDLAFRAAPSYRIAWRTPVGSPKMLILATDPDIIVVDAAMDGDGAVQCIARDGTVRWRALPDGSGAGDAAAPSDAGAEDPVQRTPTAVFATQDSIIAVRPDGSLVAFDRRTGDRRWSRRPSGDASSVVRPSSSAVVSAWAFQDDGAFGVRVEALDSSEGTVIGAWTLDGATEVDWVRVTEGGLVVIATDLGIESRRIAGGDEAAPYWSIDAFAAADSVSGWPGPGLLVFLDRSRSIAAARAWSGEATLSEALGTDSPDRGMVERVLFTPRWSAAVSQNAVQFLDPMGRASGRNAPYGLVAPIAAGAAADRLFVLVPADQDEGSDRRPTVLLRELFPMSGGLESSPPLLLRSAFRSISQLQVIEGAVAVGDLSMIQLLEFRKP